MSIDATSELANVEAFKIDKNSRFGKTPLQQFARAGLDLKIGEFRQLCDELTGTGKGIPITPHELADVLFAWMDTTLDDA